ncbi:YozQ family protein [Ornithinibacillus halophilus]|uniref:DUF4025 domain-containing protein n=1 Tax=Ornithinibacillus halophilus TaxID=930117 RepID=A0A1M5M5P9_9BACI|nr:YozQ family protein [Ornithinibacillus halophilus]SHG72596.1 Protein of unknown function [Ornithinibacillus halophilus]
MSKNDKKEMEKVAEKMYEPSYYKSNTQLGKGLATTHEQVSDTYMEGTVDAQIYQLDEQGELKSHKGEEIPRKGFNK